MKKDYSLNVELFSPIPKDKFDNHMKSARESSLKARQKAFITQNAESSGRKERYANIKSSIY